VQTGQDDLDDLLDNIGVPLQFQSALEQLLAQPAMLDSLLTDKHLLANITESFTGTWYSMQHTAAAVQTKLGVAPGDQLADVIHNLSVLPLIRGIAQSFKEAGVQLTFATEPGATSLAQRTLGRSLDDEGQGVSYVDDIMNPARLDQHQSMQFVIPNILRRVHEAAASRGVTISWTKAAILAKPGNDIDRRYVNTWLNKKVGPAH
jgi:hypothetical protein